MIEVMVGPPGSGKTLLDMQRRILPALLAGRHVYHNIRGLDPVKIAYWLQKGNKGKVITPFMIESLLHDYSYPPGRHSPMPPGWEWEEASGSWGIGEEEYGRFYLSEFPKAPSHSLMVLDEAQKKCYINSKDWNTEKNVKFFEYCSEHRHLKHEVLICTQDDGNIDSATNHLRNSFVFLSRNESLGFLFRNRVTVNYYRGHDTIRSKPYLKDGLRYDPAIYDLYSSYDVGGGVEIRRTGSIFGNFVFVVLALAILCVCFFLPRTLSAFGGKKAPSPPPSALGVYKDYYCAGREGVFVLRPSGAVDTVPASSVPSSLCPRAGFLSSEAKK